MNLSFIIPAYNASKTIIRTLDSISNLAIPEKEYEIIVVDDCSIDDTREIVATYAIRHSQVRLLCQPQNHRQGAARNWGIREARGEYIMLVDADDKVEDGVPHALQIAQQTKVDCLFCNYLWMYSDTNIEHRKLPLDDGFVCSGHDFCENYYETIINTCPISYLWKREYLQTKGVAFVEDKRMEDFDWIEQNVFNAPFVGNTTAVVYRVLTYENLQSTTHTMTYETYADWVHVAYRRLMFCNSIRDIAPTFCHNIENQCRAFVSSSLSIRRISRFSPIDIYKAFKRITPEGMKFLYKHRGWNLTTCICMKYPLIVYFCDVFVWPIASIGRCFVQSFRKNKS